MVNGLEIESVIENGVLVIRKKNVACKRRILFVMNYGMAQVFRLWQKGLYPGNHLWGCLELAQKGYEVILPEPVILKKWTKGAILAKRLKNDLVPTQMAMQLLGHDDIVYCAHNNLIWAPLAKSARLLKCKIVGQLFANEPLLFSSAYNGIIAHTLVAKKRISREFPEILSRHIPWGMDLDFFQPFPYEPRWVFSSGKTYRDFPVIFEAFRSIPSEVRILHSDFFAEIPDSVKIIDSKKLGDSIYPAIANEYYRFASMSLITLMPDDGHRHAPGVTNLLESMACGRPVIVSRTSALSDEIDVEKEGVGLFVPHSNAAELRKAVNGLLGDRELAGAMGMKGRSLCENYYNMDRFSEDLDSFFQTL